MVAIKGMEMPKNCAECFNYGCEFKSGAANRVIYKGETGRHSGCPLVEIEERKVGKWIYSGSYDVEGMLYCSNCNHEIDVSEGYFKYCPNCGAEMRGSENERKCSK